MLPHGARRASTRTWRSDTSETTFSAFADPTLTCVLSPVSSLRRLSDRESMRHMATEPSVRAMKHAGIALVLATMSAVVVAQSAAPRLAFEVASIKRNTTVDSGGGGGFAPGGRFRITNIDVMTIVMIAHRTGPQLFRSQIVGGPDWIASETYDITAKVDDDLAGKPLAELFAMQPALLRSLLEDRFKLKSHRETRELQRYALVPARKDGSFGPHLPPAT